MEEIWKDIEPHLGVYAVSNLGRVRSYDRVVETSNKRVPRRFIKGQILNLRVDTNGYAHQCLSENNKSYNYKVHRLVAKAFIPNPENKPCVNHIDGDKLNNCVDNLEWVTYSENTHHAYKTGLCRGPAVNGNTLGSKNSMSKLDESDVIGIRKKFKTGIYTQKQLGDVYGVSRRTIGDILNRNTWKHV